MENRTTAFTESDMKRIVSEVVERIIVRTQPKRPCLWIIEDMPSNGYILDHAFRKFSKEFQIDIRLFSAEVDSIDRGSLIPYGRVLTGSEGDLKEALDYEIICLFNLSLKTLSKLAHLLIDDQVTELIFSFLQNGSPVIMDAWEDRHEFARMSGGIQKKISQLLKEIESYGVMQTSFTIGEPQKDRLTNMTKKGIMSLEDLKVVLKEGGNPQTILDNIRLTPLAIDYLHDLERADGFGKR